MSLVPHIFPPTTLDCHTIAKLDPLNLDYFLTEIPSINARGDTSSLITLSKIAIETLHSTTDITNNEAFASLRDLDFLLGSCIRHELDPINDVDGFEESLLFLGRIAGTIPRGSVYTYSISNPDNERQRSFTGSLEENKFIDAVRTGTSAMDNALIKLSQSSPENPKELITGLDITTSAMDVMVGAIGKVMKTVSPEYFTHQLRPYFEPAIIGGKLYTGAGGAQMQLLGIDRILWGKTDGDETYNQFYEENFQYLTPDHQNAISHYLNRHDKTILETVLEEGTGPDNELSNATLRLLKTIRKFRYPHRKVARDNFNLRSENSVGSGSYTPEILDLLINKTEHAINTIVSEL